MRDTVEGQAKRSLIGTDYKINRDTSPRERVKILPSDRVGDAPVVVSDLCPP